VKVHQTCWKQKVHIGSWLQVNSSHGELVTKVNSSQWSRHRVKSSHGELITKVKKRDNELVTCDEFTMTCDEFTGTQGGRLVPGGRKSIPSFFDQSFRGSLITQRGLTLTLPTPIIFPLSRTTGKQFRRVFFAYLHDVATCNVKHGGLKV